MSLSLFLPADGEDGRSLLNLALKLSLINYYTTSVRFHSPPFNLDHSVTLISLTKGGLNLLNFFNCSSLDNAVTTCPREEKLYRLSNCVYQLFIAEKSLRMFPALGWMFCIVAETTVFKLWLLRRFPKNNDSLAASTCVDGQ